MRTARTIGITEKGEEEIIHPKSAPIQKQLADFQKFAREGVPKKYAVVEFQSSDGRARTLRNGISAGLKSAEEKAEDKLKHREKWLADQKKAKAEAEAKEAEDRQKRIDAVNAHKERAKAALLGLAASFGDNKSKDSKGK